MDELFSLIGKNVLITGASSGLGRQCAIDCSKQGANVALIGRDQNRLDQTLSLLTKGKHIAFYQDITDYAKLESVVTRAVEILGKFDGFIHSAGIEVVLPLKMLKPEHYEKSFAVNVIAGYEIAKHISKKKNFNENGGSLIYISSVMGVVGEPAKLAYCSSKGALIAGTKAMALELANKKIRVNAISPGVSQTEMSNALLAKVPEEARQEIINKHPLGLGTPRDVSSLCVFMLSEAARWITGTNIIIDGGYTAQ
jgi:NAD(P)-dependent dehydrogenase (short-subunit alcohol dehydrogenase family)